MTTSILREGARRHPSAIIDTSVWNGDGFVDHQDVFLDDGRVTAVHPHDPAAEDGATERTAQTRIDGRGGHVLPGFVNTHTHLQQATCRGAGEGQPLLSWLLTIGESMASITPERAYLAAVAGALEGLLSGTTTLIEHMWPHPSPAVHDAVLRALDDVGVRAVLARGVADRPDATRRWGFEPSLMQPLDEAFADIDRLRADAAGTRVTLGVAVPNPRSLTPEGMGQVRAFADARGLPVSIHLLETVTDDVQCQERAGTDAVGYLQDADFVWDGLLAVHCVQLSPVSMALFAERGTTVSWNPVSNLRLGSGFAPVLPMRDAGVRVTVGVDGAGSNDRQDMLETLRTGAYTQRALHGRADVLDFADMMRMATATVPAGTASASTDATPDASSGTDAGARFGGIVPGMLADLTIIRFDRDFACLPVTDPAASILTTGTPRIVDTVLVGGEAVVVDGASTRIHHDVLARSLSKLAASVSP